MSDNDQVSLVKIDGNFSGKSLVSIDQLTRSDADMILDQAEAMATQVSEHGRIDLLKDKVVANLFYEPSTRTYLSFMTAASRLGAGVISTQGAEFSSQAKGETLEDTIAMACRYADVIAMRHPEAGSAARAAAVTTVPFINGGDGAGEHPTQALLDVFTMRRRASKPLDELTVTLVGDLKHGRTVHSLTKLVALYGMKLRLVSPEALAMPAAIVDKYADTIEMQTTDLLEALPGSDIIYVTRVQKERFADPSEYEKLKDSYIVTADVMEHADDTALLMHPLPRVNEIAVEVDSDPRAVYFEQAENGVFVRMALLALVSGRHV